TQEYPYRTHKKNCGYFRAVERLRRRENPPLRLREIPPDPSDPRTLDAVGRRSDGDRPHVQRGAAERSALARDRSQRTRNAQHAGGATAGVAPDADTRTHLRGR